MDLLSVITGSFLLVFLAEFGDKSQLVCMTLATRYRSALVMLGAVLAFSVLNLLAVTVGVLVAAWLPQSVVLLVVALLFFWFGWQSLQMEDEEQADEAIAAGRSVLVSVFVLIFLAELGDKTQLAVTGMAGVKAAVPVWLGATLALVVTTAIGVLAGQLLMRYISFVWLHRFSAVLFILFGLYASFGFISQVT